MIVHKIYIENKIRDLNELITLRPNADNRAKKSELAWYAMILQDMEDEGAERVQLDKYKNPKNA